MPLVSTNVVRRLRTVDVDFGEGDKLTVHYNRSAYTPAFVEEVSRSRTEAEATPTLVKMLATLIGDWDYFEDEGMTEKVKITPERLSDIPFWVLNPILEKINEDAVPNPGRNGTTA